MPPKSEAGFIGSFACRRSQTMGFQPVFHPLVRMHPSAPRRGVHKIPQPYKLEGGGGVRTSRILGEKHNKSEHLLQRGGLGWGAQ